MRRLYAFFLLKTAKKNIAKGMPVVGAGLGAGINYGASRRVLDTAQHLYPERFLSEKYLSEWEVDDERLDVMVEEIFVEPEVDESDRGIMDRFAELGPGDGD